MNARTVAAALALAMLGASVVAGCGAGGSNSAIAPPPPGPSPSPQPSPTPILLGTLNVATGGTYSAPTYAAAALAGVVFSCGCSVQAGTGGTDASGTFNLLTTSTPTPAAPAPTYTIVPGRNYVVVAHTGTGAEAWTMEFAGKTTATNLGLDDSGTPAPVGSIKSSIYTAAAALYIYYYSPKDSVAFDGWNFTAIEAWVKTLATSPNTSEKTLLTDIISQSSTGGTLYPSVPTWNAAQPTYAPIAQVLQNVHGSLDGTIPTPCPTSGCTGTPTP